MDRITFEALKLVVQFAYDNSHDKRSKLRSAANQLSGWINEVEKEIDDYETLGDENRPPLKTTKRAES